LVNNSQKKSEELKPSRSLYFLCYSFHEEDGGEKYLKGGAVRRQELHKSRNNVASDDFVDRGLVDYEKTRNAGGHIIKRETKNKVMCKIPMHTLGQQATELNSGVELLFRVVREHLLLELRPVDGGALGFALLEKKEGTIPGKGQKGSVDEKQQTREARETEDKDSDGETQKKRRRKREGER
jgi:hypothetical protein